MISRLHAIFFGVLFILLITGIANAQELVDLNKDGLVDIKDIVIMQNPKRGDVNMDGRVDIYDLVILAKNFHKTSEDPDWDPRWDVANDVGVVNIKDLAVVAQEMQNQGSGTMPFGTASIYVYPSSKDALKGQNFTMDIKIDTTDPVYGYQIYVLFDKDKITGVEATKGPFLSQDGNETFFSYNIDNSTGELYFFESRISNVSGVSGSGVLATITFHADSYGTSYINLDNAILLDENIEEIPNDPENGTVTVYTPVTGCMNITDSGEYILVNDITNSLATRCINISASDVILDCRNYSITGGGAGTGGSGIRTEPGLTDVHIRNCVLTDWQYGIVFQGDHGSIINVTAESNSYCGIEIDGSANNNTIRNVATNYNENGLIFYDSYDNTIRNVATNYNENGLIFYDSHDNELTDFVSTHNSWRGVWVREDVESANNNVFTNGLVANNEVGLEIYPVSYNIFTNIRLVDNVDFGIDTSSVSSIYSNIEITNSSYGIYISGYLGEGKDNTFQNITINDSNYGFYIYKKANSNTINDSRIENNGYGLYFEHSGSQYPENNLIYNNYLNNTQNYYNSTTLTNYFNTTLDCFSGPNIIEGPCIGGNYWTNYSGDGFSDTCWGIPGKFICSTPHQLDPNNYDYLPLAVRTDETPPNINFVSPTPPDNNIVNRNYVEVNVSVSDSESGVDTVLINWNGQNYTGSYYNATGLSDGTYVFYGWTSDVSGNAAVTETRTITIDTTEPKIRIYHPFDKKTYTTTLLSLNYTVEDTNLDKVWYQYNGVNTTLSGDTTFEALNNTESILIVWAKDLAGNIVSDKIVFTVDISPPNVTFVSPQNTIYSEPEIQFNWTYEDMLSHYLDWCAFSLNDDSPNENIILHKKFELKTKLTGPSEYINSIFADDDYIYAGAGRSATHTDYNLYVWYKNNLSLAAKLPSDDAVLSVYADDDYIYYNSGKNVSVWYKNNLTHFRNLTNPKNAPVTSVYADEVYIYAGGYKDSPDDPAIYIWDKNTFSLSETLKEPTILNGYVYIYVDRHHIYAYSDDSNVYVWNKEDFSFERNLTENTQTINTLYVDNDRIYAGGSNRNVTVWDKYNFSLITVLEDPYNAVYSVYGDDDYVFAGEWMRLRGWYQSNLSIADINPDSWSWNYIPISDGVHAVFVDGDYLYADNKTEVWLFYRNIVCGNITITGEENKVNKLTLYTSDVKGNKGSETIYFTIDTSPPNVTIFSPENATYSETEMWLNFTASDNFQLGSIWYQFNGVNTTITDNTTFEAVNNSFSTIILWANDSVGNTGYDEVTFYVGENIPPVADAGGDYAGEEGSVISFDASASYDPDGSIVSYEWDFDYDGIFEADATGINASHTWYDDYSRTGALRVTDNAGAEDLDTFMITVNNVAPTADAGGPYSGDEDSAIQLYGSATDPGSDTLTYAWDLDDDGFYDDSAEQNPTYTWNDPGTYYVHLKVTDDDGANDTDTAEVTVNNIPEPDLVVSYYDVVPSNNNYVTIEFRIKNIGDAAANSFYWDITAPGSSIDPVGTEPISLEPGEESGLIYAYVRYASSGSYTATIIADYTNAVAESDEGNNQQNIPITV